jgi:small-conductance mechanosensitive channel
MNNPYVQAIGGSFETLWPSILNFSIRLIIALAIFIIGYIVGAFVDKMIQHLFKRINVDTYIRTTGVEETLRRGGVNLNSGAFIGALVKYFIIVVFLIASFQVVGLDQVTLFLQQVVVAYLPQVIIAVLILLAAVVIGDIMQRLVRAAASSAGIRHAGMLGSVTKWAIWIFAILTVLVQLGIGADLIRILFTGVVVAFSLAFGLAFGLGGQGHAADLISRAREEMADKIDRPM